MLRNQIKIGNWTYKINPAIKKYALRDAGFTQTTHGEFKYTHPLYLDSPYDTIGFVKIDVNESLTQLDILTVGNDKMTKINLFKNKKLQPVVDLLKFNLDDLVEREIISEVK